MKLVKFEDGRYDSFVTSKNVDVDLVLNHLRDICCDEFIYDPELPFDSHNNVVYNNTENYCIRFKETYIEER